MIMVVEATFKSIKTEFVKGEPFSTLEELTNRLLIFVAIPRVLKFYLGALFIVRGLQ